MRRQKNLLSKPTFLKMINILPIIKFFKDFTNNRKNRTDDDITDYTFQQPGKQDFFNLI